MSQYTLTLTLAALATASLLPQLPIPPLLLTALSALAAWAITVSLIPKVKEFMLRQGVFGLDINKRGSEAGQKKIPECIGFAAAVAFCIVGLVLTPLLVLYANQQALITHLATMITVLATILLGFADDMLELPWRYKLLFPFFIILPLVSVYHGPTHITLISPFSHLFGRTLDLGHLFLVYITLLGIYKTNTINIFAGINGLQVGQSIVAASAMLGYFATDSLLNGHPERYQYSAYLLLSFIASALALMKINAYPAQIFIGDTFCYFAGIVLAIAAVYGQIPIVCHWFVIPQLINFLYSIPQLFGFVPCPRHRLTTYDQKTDTLSAVPTNLNLLNLSLIVLGPTNEGKLCLKLLLFQSVLAVVPIIHLLLVHSNK